MCTYYVVRRLCCPSKNKEEISGMLHSLRSRRADVAMACVCVLRLPAARLGWADRQTDRQTDRRWLGRAEGGKEVTKGFLTAAAVGPAARGLNGSRVLHCSQPGPRWAQEGREKAERNCTSRRKDSPGMTTPAFMAWPRCLPSFHQTFAHRTHGCVLPHEP